MHIPILIIIVKMVIILTKRYHYLTRWSHFFSIMMVHNSWRKGPYLQKKGAPLTHIFFSDMIGTDSSLMKYLFLAKFPVHPPPKWYRFPCWMVVVYLIWLLTLLDMIMWLYLSPGTALAVWKFLRCKLCI